MQQVYPLTTQSLKQTIHRVCLTYAGLIAAITLIPAIIIIAVMVFDVFNQIMLAGGADALANMGPEATAELVDDIALRGQVNNLLNNHSGLLQLVSVAAAVPVFFFIRGRRLVTSDITTRRQTPRFATILSLFGLALGVQFIMILINAAFTFLFGEIDVSLTESMDEGMTSLTADPFGLLYIIILGPLCEEIVFRGAILRALEPYGANFAIITSSILFGLYHIILFQAVFAFFLGLVLAYTAGRFSLKWAYLLHVANNALATSSLFLAPLIGEELYAYIIFFLFFAGFIFMIIYLSLKHNVFRAQRVAGAPVVAHPFKTLFARPAFLVTAILIILLGVMMLIP